MSPQIISLTGHAPKISELVWDTDLSAPTGKTITATTAETANNATNATNATTAETATNAQKLNNKTESQLEVSKANTAVNAQKLNNKQESELEVNKAALLKPCQVNNGCVTRIEFDSEANEMKCWISNGTTEE